MPVYVQAGLFMLAAFTPILLAILFNRMGERRLPTVYAVFVIGYILVIPALYFFTNEWRWKWGLWPRDLMFFLRISAIVLTCGGMAAILVDRLTRE